MNTQFAFVLFDHTTEATPENLRPASSFQAMIDAWTEGLTGDFANAYGEVFVSFRVAASPDDRKPAEIGIHFRDTIPEAPGALAYHQVVGGVPDIEIGCDLFSTVLTGTESMCMGGDHEIKETIGDPGGNRWNDRQDASQTMDAGELCDMVQNTGKHASNGAMLSNFLLPNAFIPGATGPWDNMGVMSAQYDVSNGYGIVADSPQTENQIGGMSKGMRLPVRVRVVGKLSEKQAKRKNASTSRTLRRGVHAEHVKAITVK